ncbi:MAG: tyrosine recombinase XerC [Candidatus Atribacteria bacterium]|nr:tyrosine recombinase XerC [Candidatus Atribacteria bacterium]
MTAFDCIKSYENYLKEKKNFSLNTIQAYKKDLVALANYINKNERKISLSQIDYHLLRRYINHLRQEKYADKTIARKISSFRGFFKYLIQQGVADKNAAKYVQIPKIKKKLPDFLFYEEVVKLMDAININKNRPTTLRDRAIIELLYGTGMRVAELAQLNVEDIFFGDEIVKVLGKGSKERILPISKPVKVALKNYLDIKITIKKKNNLRLNDENALFINRFGERLSTRSIRRVIDKYMRLACINKKISPHVFRHTFATHLLSGGADLRSVQELLGHESLSTTQIYTHVTKDKLIKDYNKYIPRK